MGMKITIDIDTPEEMKEISAFLEKKRHPHAINFEERRKRLEKFFSEVRGHLPEGYKFDRNSLYDRPNIP
jgi:hypothetical protein